MDRLKVLHLITHFAVGGATENTLATCLYTDRSRFESSILSGETADCEETLVRPAAEHGIQVHILPGLHHEIRPRADACVFHALVDWLRRNPCDILHTHGSKAGILGRFAGRRARVPILIHTVHGWGFHDFMSPIPRRIYAGLERRAARITDRIIVVAEANREKGLSAGVGEWPQYEVIHSGIDILRYSHVGEDGRDIRRSLGIPTEAPVVGTVSRLAKQKDPLSFLEVARRVRVQFPHVKFIFAGGGPLQSRFRLAIREMGLQDTVLYLGYRSDVPQLLRAFDVFLLTSLWEGLPRVFPQAMCADLPIVATCVDGAPEAVQDGENGFLTAPKDVKGMAARVCALLGDSGLRREMGRAGRDRVDPEFCDREMVRRIESVYLAAAGLDSEELLLRATA